MYGVCRDRTACDKREKKILLCDNSITQFEIAVAAAMVSRESSKNSYFAFSNIVILCPKLNHI